MHVLQRRRRSSLRRRVANGEVDLEALGIKRLTVPQHLLDEMPLYSYGTDAKTETATATSPTERKNSSSKSASATISSKKRNSLSQQRTPPRASISAYHPTPLQQPTCPICLDDFVQASEGVEGTTVRELPCHHIFHPECVDNFLRDNSSLCPMCKKSSLPKGYCPRTITNAMVRRERMVRQLRPLNDGEGAGRVGRSRIMNMPFEIRSRMRGRAVSSYSQQMHPMSRSASSPIIINSAAAGTTATTTAGTGAGAGFASALPSSQQMRQLSTPSLAAMRTATTTTFPTSPSALPTSPPSQIPPTSPQRSPTSPAPAALIAPGSADVAPRISTASSRPSPTHREWARQRALDMLGPRHEDVPVDPDAEEVARTSVWRRALRGVFPGFGGGGVDSGGGRNSATGRAGGNGRSGGRGREVDLEQIGG